MRIASEDWVIGIPEMRGKSRHRSIATNAVPLPSSYNELPICAFASKLISGRTVVFRSRGAKRGTSWIVRGTDEFVAENTSKCPPDDTGGNLPSPCRKACR